VKTGKAWMSKGIVSIRSIIKKYPFLFAYVLLGVGAVCCVISLVLVLGSEQPEPELLMGEVMAQSAEGVEPVALEQTADSDQVSLTVAEAAAAEGQVVSGGSSGQTQLADSPDSWQGYTVGEEVNGFVVRSAPVNEESGLYIQKPPEIAETYIIEESAPPPPPRALDRKVIQSIVGIVSKTTNLNNISPDDYEGSDQNQAYYEGLMHINDELHTYLPEYTREFIAILKDNQYFSYAQYLVEFLSGYYAGEGYDAKDFRGSADTRQYLNEWIERVEGILGLL